ncbi:sulfatase-like hydrolase/transferase [Maribacter sp. 2210JD10-5]|uniref:sulfatase-like hydrolase/transferase n=1 Tax=Maribacter sp. 2210JD10-5 TaxID=3386272 RepID=UPI0039BD5D4E
MKFYWSYFLWSVFLLSGCTTEKKDISDNGKSEVINPKINAQPNIVWIVAEDQSPNIPAFGDSTVVTPNLDKLASQGVCYDNFFTPHPVCGPARAAIITGMYASSIGASHMRTGPWFNDTITQGKIDSYKALPEENIAYQAVPAKEVKMFTEYLRAAGYYCTNNDKEDYQFIRTMTSWDESSKTAHWRNRPKNKPFFSVFNIGVTHESQIWRKQEDSLWTANDLKVPVPPYLPDTEVGRRDIRRMYSNILEMDAEVGKILKELEEDGLLENTIIFWYTDHGGPLPRQKRLLYDSGIKVPLIIRFPKKQFAGQRDNRMISFIDLAPTMLSLAGIKPLDHIQGSAFLGKYIRDNEPEYVFGAADRFDELTDRIRSVRDKQFKYIKNFEPQKPLYADMAYRKQMPIMQELLALKEKNQLTKEQALWFNPSKPNEELYDLTIDPYELNNLADNPKYKQQLERLRKACKNWVTRINDKGLRPEKELIESFWPNEQPPKTANPTFIIIKDALKIDCTTEGASIGYRFITDDEKNPSWKVYHKPIKIHQGDMIQAIAHRLGYKRSQEKYVKID